MSLYILKCDNCGKSNELDPKNFLYGEEDRIEKELGEEVTYSVTEYITCECGEDIRFNHIFVEYPKGEEVDSQVTVEGAALINEL